MSGAAPTGAMRLRAARLGARTVLAEASRTAPFHPGPAHYHDPGGAAEVIVQEVGPGVFPGDRLRAEVIVEAGAALAVRGQGATRLYPAPPGAVAVISTSLRVAAGASLWWLPGDLLPYADASLEALTEVDLAPDARFLLLEIVTAGRAARGERDAYRRLDLRLRIDRGGEPLLRERALLDPAARPPARGGYDCSALLVLAGFPPLDPAGLRVPDGLAGMDSHGGLTVARAVGNSAFGLREALLAAAREALPGPGR
ncbi:MAG: urease accessory protein UreD [Chloroflexota bacterium]